MSSSRIRFAAVAVVSLVGLIVLVSVLTRTTQPDAPSAPVAALVSADPKNGAARGTMIMIHGGGWAGHDAFAQELLMKSPGGRLLKRGWRVVSVDYHEGAAGLDDLLNAVRAEGARRTSDGPLCIYGESSGAHLALVAASRLGAAIDCVIGLGTPTDLNLYTVQGAKSSDQQVGLLATRITRFFGSTSAGIDAWSPVALAPRIKAAVLLIRQSDDRLIPRDHSTRFDAAHPNASTVELEAGDDARSATDFPHGTISEAGRARYVAAIGSFADAAAARKAGSR